MHYLYCEIRNIKIGFHKPIGDIFQDQLEVKLENSVMSTSVLADDEIAVVAVEYIRLPIKFMRKTKQNQ